MRLLRWLAAGIVWILAGVVGLLGIVLSITLVLLPLGLPLIWLSRRLFGVAGRLVVPRAARHPVAAATEQAVDKGRTARRAARKQLRRAASTGADVKDALPGKRRRGLARLAH